MSRSRFAVFGAAGRCRTPQCPCPIASSRAEERARAARVSSTSYVAVLHRELGERGLLRRTEGAELLDGRQRLLDQRRRSARTRVLVCGTPVISDSVVSSLIEGAQADVGFGRQIRRGVRRGRRHRRIRSRMAVGADAIEGQEEHVVEHALLETA